MNKHFGLVASSLLVVVCIASSAHGQVPIPWIGNVGDYNVDDNWGINPTTGFSTGKPLAMPFGETGLINNGGTAFVANTPISPGGITLGQGASDSGTLEIRSGGDLAVMAGTQAAPAPGTIVVGQAGTGHLIVLRGGTLSGVGLSSGGSAASSIQLGQTGGAGNAQVTISGAANLGRTTQVIGPNVNFQANSLTLSSQHNLVAQITGATHSPLRATGTATLGGTLTVDFDGVTPMVGNTWQLVTANSISGNFASVSSDATLQPGYGLFVQNVPGPMGGRVAQLALEARLSLSVDRRTGETILRNLTSDQTFNIDGYLITSPGEGLNPNNWSSFQDANLAGWRESNPGARHVGELNLTSSRMVGPNTNINLGNLYGFAPSQIGQTLEDLEFTYHVAGGQTVAGLINYTGPHNNLVLFVDPATGETAIVNQSTFNVNVDGYLITSPSSSLDVNGWASLEGAGMAGWRESNPAANHVGELNLTGSSLLAAGTGVWDLGTLFDFDKPGVQRDLTFEFNIAGGEPMQGIIEYAPIPDVMPPIGIPGDYNNSGQVEQADLDLVLLNWGQPTPPIPPGWTNDLPVGAIDQEELDKVLLNWGNTAGLGLSTASAVPEPATWLLALVLAAAAAAIRRK